MNRGSVSVSSFFTLYRPSKCERRVYLAATETVAVEPTELELLIREMGEEHEREHLAGFPEYRDLGEGGLADRARRTREAVAAGTPVIYQGVMRRPYPGTRDVVTGIPDFLIRDGDGYRVRECKLSRSLEEKDHPEIRRQLQERSVNPMELKKRLAREIVGQYHGPEEAEEAAGAPASGSP